MDEQRTIMADVIGNPFRGKLDRPWPSGHPVVGERVAIFAFEVTTVDKDVADMRNYHVMPATSAIEGPITPTHDEPQAITDKWIGCGTGTVVRPADVPRGRLKCEVLPDDPRIV